MSPSLIFIAGIAAMIAALCLYRLLEKAIARKAEQQLSAERQMRRGFKTAARMGWLPEDTQ